MDNNKIKRIWRNKICIEENCKLLASFNYLKKTAIYCSLHKKENMFNIKSKICCEENCQKRPNYNFPDIKSGIYCFTHKKENMKDVVNKVCKEDNCKLRPNFNYIGEKTAIYCSTHKKENMYDVISNKCIEPNCQIKPSFNFEGLKTAIYCSQHKKENMISIHGLKCIEPNCKICPLYNFDGETKALYCNSHKKDNMINVINKTCKTHLCRTILKNQKYRGYCMPCFMHTFPDEPVSRNYRTKEKIVKDFIFSSFPSETWIWDKTIQDGCSKHRPDFYNDCGDKIIIVEIDENQHTHYDTTCEIARLNNLVQDVYFRPVIIIRFNPDGYTNENGEKIKSPWIRGKDGIIRITKETDKDWNERLKQLKQEIDNAKLIQSDELVQMKYLFYSPIIT
jgi:hypothetical protein